MDPVVPKLEEETRRRRSRRLFRRRVPVRMMVPNFFTLLGLCAGLTSIRMAIEHRWDLALLAIVFAAFLDGIDGRVARLLKASSRFGAELDSLADFVNFGVAPAVFLFTWFTWGLIDVKGFGDVKSLGWICVMIFALASALRLARFNVSLDEESPRWQSNYFQGVPTPAAAIVVLLPFFMSHIGWDVRSDPIYLNAALVYTLVIALLMVTVAPTFSGKLLGERIGNEWVLPVFIGGVSLVALLVTYPFLTLTGLSLLYLLMIPVSWRRYQQLKVQFGDDGVGDLAGLNEVDNQSPNGDNSAEDGPAVEPTGRVVGLHADKASHTSDKKF